LGVSIRESAAKANSRDPGLEDLKICSLKHDEAWKMPEKNQDDEIFQRFTPTVGITKP